MEIGAKQYDKEGVLFGPQNVTKSRRAKMGLPSRTSLNLFCEISDICGEMNPLVFSALEEVNLVFTLMVSSTVMVDIVFACFMNMYSDMEIKPFSICFA